MLCPAILSFPFLPFLFSLLVQEIVTQSLQEELQRAMQCERLAKMFFEQKNMEMSKSYAGQAIAIRQRIAKQFGVKKVCTVCSFLVVDDVSV